MRRIIIMSGPAKLRIPAIIGVISVLVNGKLFFTYSTNFLDLYSRSVICGVVWAADICEMAAFPQVFFARME